MLQHRGVFLFCLLRRQDELDFHAILKLREPADSLAEQAQVIVLVPAVGELLMTKGALEAVKAVQPFNRHLDDGFRSAFFATNADGGKFRKKETQ